MRLRRIYGMAGAALGGNATLYNVELTKSTKNYSNFKFIKKILKIM